MLHNKINSYIREFLSAPGYSNTKKKKTRLSKLEQQPMRIESRVYQCSLYIYM